MGDKEIKEIKDPLPPFQEARLLGQTDKSVNNCKVLF